MDDKMVGNKKAFYISFIALLLIGLVYLFVSYESIILPPSYENSNLDKKRESISKLKQLKKLMPLGEMEDTLRLIDMGSLSRIDILEVKLKSNSGKATISGDVLGVVNDALYLQKRMPIKYTSVESDGKQLKLDFEYYGTRKK